MKDVDCKYMRIVGGNGDPRVKQCNHPDPQCHSGGRIILHPDTCTPHCHYYEAKEGKKDV